MKRLDCLECKKEFCSRHSHPKFCGTVCSRKYYNREWRIKYAKDQGKELKISEDKNCVFCSKIMQNCLPHKKYCSDFCRREYHKKEMGFDVYDNENLNNISRGAMNEMIVCADLIRNGFEVFKAIALNSCDIAILKNKILYRVEVTTGNVFSKDAKINFPSKDKNKFDILAIVLRDGKIIYTPNLDDIKSQN